MLMPTCTEDMEVTDMDMVLAMLDTMAMGLDTADSMASVRLRLSPRLMLMPTCTEDMEVTDMDMVLAMLDTMAMGLDTADSMASVRLMPSLRLTPTFSMVDMPDTTDMLDTTDTHMADILSMDKLPPKTTITRWNQRTLFSF